MGIIISLWVIVIELDFLAILSVAFLLGARRRHELRWARRPPSTGPHSSAWAVLGHVKVDLLPLLQSAVLFRLLYHVSNGTHGLLV